MPYIYKITNQINQKIYIGKTTSSIERRFRQHIQDSQKESYKKRPLYLAMKKYGIENFSIEKIEECSIEELSNREKYWIEVFQSFKNGYNATAGGDGKPYLDYDLIYKTYLNLKSSKKTALICKCDEHSVQKVLDNYNISREERLQNRIINRSKKVAKIDKETNKILEIYDSIKSAEKANGNSRHICDVCKGKRKTCQGYKWKYLNN